MSASDLPDDLVNLFLRSIRNQFYQGHEKLFFQEKRMLLMAITYPASYLKERGVGLPEKDRQGFARDEQENQEHH